jgi:hypothetical protein
MCLSSLQLIFEEEQFSLLKNRANISMKPFVFCTFEI